MNTINAELYSQTFQILKISVLHTLLAKWLCYTGCLSVVCSIYKITATWNEPQKKNIIVI